MAGGWGKQSSTQEQELLKGRELIETTDENQMNNVVTSF